MITPETPLLQDEKQLATWTPNLFSFAQRALLLGFATALFLGGFGYTGWMSWVIVLPLASIFFVFLFDDHTNWFRHRHDLWHLTSLRIIYENRDTPEDSADFALMDITGLRRWFWWSLRINLSDGRNMAIKYVSRPGNIRSEIRAARDARGAAGYAPTRPRTQTRGWVVPVLLAVVAILATALIRWKML